MSTIKKHCQDYLNYLNSYLLESTVMDHRKLLHQFLSWAEARESFTEKDLVDFQLTLSHLKQGSQYKYTNILKAFFLWCYDTGRIDSNPALLLHMKAPQNVPVSFSPSIINEILNGFPDDELTGVRDKAFVSLAYSACLRRAEIIDFTIG